MNSSLNLGCSHKPKTIKKIGILNGAPCEILVCSNCRLDSDLQSFSEIPLLEALKNE